MENGNQTTYLTIGVTAIAGVIGLLGWHTYNNSSYEEPSTNLLSHEEKPEGLKENTEAAKELGVKVWNLIPGKEDVVDLLTRKEFLV